MYATNISWDDWQAGRSNEHKKPQPNQSDIEAAVRRLDSRQYTIVIVEGRGEAHLAVGGGGGKYVVYATFDNRRFINLLGDTGLMGTEELLIGGQIGDYPVARIVDRSRAMTAALTFARNGQLDPNFEWERQATE